MPDLQPRLCEADRHLLDQVAAGDENGWRILVSRFQPRLTAFSRSKLSATDRTSVTEDLVQETFVSFLQAVASFRGECSLETYLFRILRFRLNDYFRKRGSASWVSSCEIATDHVAGSDLSVSQHAVQNEQRLLFETILGSAIFEITCELKERAKFRDLKIAEGLFFAGLRNQQLADLIEIPENEVAVVKHRLVKRLRAALANTGNSLATGETFESTLLPSLQQIWENVRPSCPKRTSLGRYSLEILPPDWTDFIAFHVESLGCAYCRANLAELTAASDSPSSTQQNEVLFQSTIGFLKRRP